jgi:hypothetical protein
VAVDEEDTGLAGLAAAAVWDPRAVEILAARPGRLELRVAGAGPRLLASSLPSPAGWRATTRSGARLRTVVVNGAFFGTVLPGGTDRLVLGYLPPGFVLGGWLSLLGALAVGALGLRIQSAPP